MRTQPLLKTCPLPEVNFKDGVDMLNVQTHANSALVRGEHEFWTHSLHPASA